MRRFLLPLLLLWSLIGHAAWAQCTPYPYTLLNGSTADATQVMGNFNSILNCANNNLAPISSPSFVGNVGIGTGSPADALDVESGNIRVALGNGLTTPRATDGGIIKMLAMLNGSNTTMLNGGYGSGGATSQSIQFATNGAAVGTVLGNGNFGIGTLSPQSKMGVSGGLAVGSSYAGVSAAPANGAIIQGAVGIGTSSPSTMLQVNGTAGGTSAWQVISDGRLKMNVTPIHDALSLVTHLRGVQFEWLSRGSRDPILARNLDLPEDGRHLGFIAQEVATVVPEAVVAPPLGVAHGAYSIKEADLIPVLVEAIKQQQAQIENFSSRLSALQNSKR